MTDRELLELAAKAAGIKLRWITHYDTGLTDEYIVPLPDHAHHFVEDIQPYPRWDPLDDDGDALRLAMKLRLYVYVGSMRTAVSSWSLGMEPEDAVKEDFSDSTDEAVAAATRRAIVRAAAEIGKEMKP